MRNISYEEKKTDILFWILPGVFLLAGGLIYLFFRPANFVFFNWISFLGLEEWMIQIRKTTLPFYTLLPEWFVFSFPNFLWAFAFSFLIIRIWFNNHSRIKYIWYAIIPLVVLGFEFLQYFKLIKGTFSISDLVFGIFGILASVIFLQLIDIKRNHEKRSI